MSVGPRQSHQRSLFAASFLLPALMLATACRERAATTPMEQASNNAGPTTTAVLTTSGATILSGAAIDAAGEAFRKQSDGQDQQCAALGSMPPDLQVTRPGGTGCPRPTNVYGGAQ